TAGLWVEDELNLFQRLTILPGVRYDWTKSISPDSDIIGGDKLVQQGTPIVKYYTFPTTGATTPGLGTLYTWNTFSPRVGANTKPPYTNSSSLGLDRAVGRNMAVSVSVAYKRWHDQLGWTDIGGTYGTQVITTTLGNQLTVFPRTSAAAPSIYLLNTPSNLFETYKGIITQFTKRMSNRWMAGVGYTYSKTKQVLPSLGGNSATDGGNGQ